MVASTIGRTPGSTPPTGKLGMRASDTPPTLSVTEAVPVTVPPVLAVKVTVHWPLVLVPVVAQVSVMLVAGASLSFFFNDTATTEIYALSLHDALPISFTVTVKV